MIIGIDFDNTIVCYDRIFHTVCRERQLIPPEIPVNKSEVRNYLRRIGKEEAWTEIQGYVYGARMSEAEPFPGVLELFTRCSQRGIDLRIVSHKTRSPFKGERFDLHEAAMRWLEQYGFFDPAGIGLPRDSVHFELTREAKLERIVECRCDWFVDDLPEVLLEPRFPAGVRRMLFDPSGLYSDGPNWTRIRGWDQAREILCQ